MRIDPNSGLGQGLGLVVMGADAEMRSPKIRARLHGIGVQATSFTRPLGPS